VFTTLAGGLGALPEPLAKASGAIVRTGATVRALARADHGWLLTIGPASAPPQVEADAVVLALPARPASRLLADVPGAGSAARALAEIEYASMATVTPAYPRCVRAGPPRGIRPRRPRTRTFWASWRPAANGASGHGRPVKAGDVSTAVAAPRVRRGRLPSRCSVGRIGEEVSLQRDDDELARLAAAEREATGVTGALSIPASP
jgi:oxygen-dependent protoporphyrinogen oxidase